MGLRLSGQNLFFFRLFTIIISASGLVIRQIISCSVYDSCFYIYNYFTIQSNLMVFGWLLYVLLSTRSESRERAYGFIKGAFTTYITITFLVFMIALEPTYNPVGIELYATVVNHYITPNLFILDTLLSETKRYSWKWVYFWLGYPLAYLGFSQIHGAITHGDYLYPFLNVKELGTGVFLIWVIGLTSLCLGLGTLYISINRKYLTSENT